MIPKRECAEILERAEHATSGPWEQEFEDGTGTNFVIKGNYGIAECYDGPHDAAFIASAREDLPKAVKAYQSNMDLLEEAGEFIELMAMGLGVTSRPQLLGRITKAVSAYHEKKGAKPE